MPGPLRLLLAFVALMAALWYFGVEHLGSDRGGGGAGAAKETPIEMAARLAGQMMSDCPGGQVHHCMDMCREHVEMLSKKKDCFHDCAVRCSHKKHDDGEL